MLHWRTAKGRWVPEMAVASQPKHCMDMGECRDGLALALPVPQLVLNSRGGGLGMGAGSLWSQAWRWGRTSCRLPGDHVYGTFSCGDTSVAGGVYRRSPGRRDDYRHAQLGTQDHPMVSRFAVRIRGSQGRLCVACWTFCVRIRVPVRQGIGWGGPIDPP